MIETIAHVNSVLNGIVWGVPAIVVILGVGIYLSFKTRFIQVRKFTYAFKRIASKFFDKTKPKPGEFTPFQAVCTALAATIGTGSVAGVAGAVTLGGPGALFWMWVASFFGMCTKMVEVTLAMHYRERNKDGEYVGGPMYYIKNGLGKKWMWLAYVFAAFGALAVFGTGNATQVNTIVSSINSALASFDVIPAGGTPTLNLWIGIALTVLTGFVLLGGIRRLGSVTEKLVPFMAALYILLALGVVIINYKYIGYAFKLIFVGAFDPKAVTGGAVGTMFMALRRGVSRGIFATEAGLGTAPIAHSASSEKDPVKQGMFGIFEVFITSIVICTLTGLVIICGNQGVVNFGAEAGAELTIAGFVSTYGGWVSIFTAVAICCFAFSTVLGWGLYGERCLEFLLGRWVNKPFMVIYSLVCILGATLDLGLIWQIADTFNGLMAIPNLIALALLAPVANKLSEEFFRDGKNPF